MLIELIMLLAAGQAAPADVEVVKDKDPVVCEKKTEHTVGTRIKAKRICMRKSEWAAIERQTQRDLQKMKDRWIDPGTAGGKD